MRDGNPAAGKYVTILLFWLIPVALILIPVVYPTEGYVREILVLPVIFLLLYIAFLLSPLFRPLRNIDFFDDENLIDEACAHADQAGRAATGRTGALSPGGESAGEQQGGDGAAGPRPTALCVEAVFVNQGEGNGWRGLQGAPGSEAQIVGLEFDQFEQGHPKDEEACGEQDSADSE